MHLRPSGLRAKRPTYVPALVAITQTSILGDRQRRLSPREAARLQGLPEWFDFGDQPDAATYKQMGNGVNVGAAYHVFREHVLATLDAVTKRSARPGSAVDSLASVPDASDRALLGPEPSRDPASREAPIPAARTRRSARASVDVWLEHWVSTPKGTPPRRAQEERHDPGGRSFARPFTLPERASGSTASSPRAAPPTSCCPVAGSPSSWTAASGTAARARAQDPFTGPNAALWEEKMRRNAERDRRSTALAEGEGWDGDARLGVRGP